MAKTYTVDKNKSNDQSQWD